MTDIQMTEPKRVYGYARVSTRDQNLEAQIDAIKRWCEYSKYQLVDIFQDKASGKNINRDGWLRMCEDLETNAQGIEAIIVWRLDRIGRSVSDLIRIAKDMESRKVDIIFISNSIDTTTKEGRLFFYIMAGLAEYEREVILERTALGREYARERNVKFGRKKSTVNLDYYRKKMMEGVPLTRIAKDMKISPSTLYRRIREEN